MLTRLLRTDRLDVEVGHVRRPLDAPRRARTGTAQRVPLIRDETGTCIVGAAYWLPPGERRTIHGEAVVDDTVLFDGEAHRRADRADAGACPACGPAAADRTRPRRWVTGRAAQLGTTGARRGARRRARRRATVRRSTFYRHTEGWLRVR